MLAARRGRTLHGSMWRGSRVNRNNIPVYPVDTGMTNPTTHKAVVTYDPHQRYPFRITCDQGCQLRGYAAEHAAQLMADYHTDNPEVNR